MGSADRRTRLAILPAAALAAAIALHCATDAPTAPPRQPADTAFTVSWPFFSRDGATVFFVGRRFGVDGAGIYEVDTAGGEARLVMEDSLEKVEPKLSPDGRMICYRAGPRFRLDCCAQLYLTNVDRSGTSNITPWGSGFQSVLWSPDGSSITASGLVEEGGVIRQQIFRINVDGSGWALLTHGPESHSAARWDADGANIFYGTGHPTNALAGIVGVMDADGSRQRLLDTTLHEAYYARPSPARKELALLYRSEATSEVGGYLLAYDSIALPTGEGSFQKVSDVFPSESEWSPDGDLLGQLREGTAGSVTSDLYLVRRDGWTTRRLTESYRISWWDWSRDSRSIVFLSAGAAEERSGVFIADVPTGRIRKLAIQP